MNIEESSNVKIYAVENLTQFLRFEFWNLYYPFDIDEWIVIRINVPYIISNCDKISGLKFAIEFAVKIWYIFETSSPFNFKNRQPMCIRIVLILAKSNFFDIAFPILHYMTEKKVCEVSRLSNSFNLVYGEGGGGKA